MRPTMTAAPLAALLALAACDKGPAPEKLAAGQNEMSVCALGDAEKKTPGVLPTTASQLTNPKLVSFTPADPAKGGKPSYEVKGDFAANGTENEQYYTINASMTFASAHTDAEGQTTPARVGFSGSKNSSQDKDGKTQKGGRNNPLYSEPVSLTGTFRGMDIPKITAGLAACADKANAVVFAPSNDQ